MNKDRDKLPDEIAAICTEAIDRIDRTPLFNETAARLRLFPIRYIKDLDDRAQLSLNAIFIGPKAVEGGPTSLAGTLVHEDWHRRQNPFLKTVSFWRGVFTRTHPMRLFEWPAYRRQIAFLRAAARAQIDPGATGEAEQVLESFRRHYGEPPEQIPWGRRS
jgi:hypothetical protein